MTIMMVMMMIIIIIIIIIIIMIVSTFYNALIRYIHSKLFNKAMRNIADYYIIIKAMI